MKRNIVVIIILICLLAAGYFFIFQKKEVHYHAGFKVFVDGKPQDFSDYKYMSLIPCGKSDDSSDQEEKAHLHDQVGDVVHVHRNNAYWEDLFKNIHFTIDSHKPLEGYINGKRVANILKEKIMPYDTIIILIGKKDKHVNYLKQAVKKERIVAVEKKSELCAK